jgi:hypothetical protein
MRINGFSAARRKTRTIDFTFFVFPDFSRSKERRLQMRLHKIYIIVATVLLLLLVAASVVTAQTVAPQEAPASPDAIGTVKIIKTVPTIAGQPGETFNFSYTDPTPANGTFSLTAPGTATQRTQTFNNAPLGNWTVTETAPLPAGWALTSITCTGGGTGGAPVLPYTVSLANRRVTFQLTQNETITCTFNNEKKVDIFVGKYEDTNGNALKDPGELRLGGWTFNLYDSVTGAFVSTATSTTTGDVKLGNQVTAGQYAVCEVLPSGWYASWVAGATANEPLPKFGPGPFCATATFTAASSTVEFGNVKAPEVRIVKNAVPTDPAATFTFTQTVPLPNATPSKDVPVVPFEWVGVKCPAGTTAIAGTIGVGDSAQQTALWVPGAFVIDPPNTYNYPTTPPGANVPTFASGETGFLAQNDGDSESSFTVSVTCQYPNTPATFTLTGANDATAQQAFTGLKVGVKYTFEERDPKPVWAWTSLSCVLAGGGTPPTAGFGRTLEVTPSQSGQVITCTYKNTKNGQIIVNKTTDPSPDPANTVFTFAKTGGTYAGSFTLKDGEQNVSGWLTPATAYTVAENSPGAAWLVTYTCASANGTSTITYTTASRRANITLGAGDTVTCDYLNTKKGTINIVKKAIGGSGTFNFTGDLGAFALSPSSGGTVTNTVTNQLPDTYVVTETSQSGWYLSGLTCVDPSGNSTVNPATGAATIELDPGETVTCTYENTRLGRIRVVKNTVPSVGVTQTFTFTVTGGPDGVNIPLAGIPSGGNKQTPQVLKPGTYLVTEQALPDWDMTGVTCSNNSVWPNVSVAAGQTVTCTVTNTQRGKIIVDKVTVPAALPDVFSFTTTGPGYAPFTLTDQSPPNDSGPMVPITYTVTEADPGADWLVAYNCTTTGSSIITKPAPRKAQIVLAPGDTVRCTYTNTRLAQIVAYKYRDLGADGDYNPPVDYLLDDGWDMTLYRRAGQGWVFVRTQTTDATGKTMFSTLAPATYAVCETQKSGWQNSEPGGPGTVPGLQGICTQITNVQYGNVNEVWFGNYQTRLTIVKVTNPAGDPQTFDFSGTWNFTLDTNPATTLIPDRKMWVVQPTTFYTVKEEDAFAAPWNLQNINCQFTPVGSGNWTVTGGDTLLVTVPNGADAVCTFTNVKITAPPACALYDFNNDGMIDIIDLGMVAARWMNPALYDVRFDVAPAGAPNGVIDIADIAAVAVRVVSTCP